MPTNLQREFSSACLQPSAMPPHRCRTKTTCTPPLVQKETCEAEQPRLVYGVVRESPLLGHLRLIPASMTEVRWRSVGGPYPVADPQRGALFSKLSAPHPIHTLPEVEPRAASSTGPLDLPDIDARHPMFYVPGNCCLGNFQSLCQPLTRHQFMRWKG